MRAFRETEQRALQRLNQRELAVGPLEETAARRLAELLVGRDAVDSSDDAETVARESGGSPFFARELARYLQSAPSQTARHIDLEAMLVARLEGLPPPAQRLMETLAVAGRPTSQHEILAASGVVDDVPLFLARLKAEHLIRVSGTELEPLLETYHDRIREATLAQIAPPRLPDVHGRLADAIFSSLQVSFDDLARWRGSAVPWTARRRARSLVPRLATGFRSRASLRCGRPARSSVGVRPVGRRAGAAATLVGHCRTSVPDRVRRVRRSRPADPLSDRARTGRSLDAARELPRCPKHVGGGAALGTRGTAAGHGRNRRGAGPIGVQARRPDRSGRGH